MKISVTQEDIDNGVKGECEHCAIALALLRCCDAKRVEIEEALVISVDGRAMCAKEWLKVDDFIVKFDNWKPVAPFDFELEEKYEDEDGEEDDE